MLIGILVLSTAGCNFFGNSGSSSTVSNGGSDGEGDNGGDPGGDSGPTGDSEGFFIDSGVEGLTYTASPSGLTGTTDADGRYEYNAGDTITFSIGSIVLGSSAGSEYVTPMSFNPDDEEMGVRIAQLLQSMDSDKTPGNGITLDPAAIEALKDIDLTSDSFETDLRDKLPANLAFVERDAAMNHMETTFNTYAINPNGHNHTIPKIFPGYDSEHGMELWITKDGKTPEFVKELDEGGTLGSYPYDFTKVGDKIFFTATTPQYGKELWVTDGTDAGTHMVKDITEGMNSTNITWLTPFGDKVIFNAGPAYDNQEPWISDGTPEGTFILKDIYEGFLGSNPEHFTVYKDKVYFFAKSENEGNEVWSTDGTPEGTKILIDYNPVTGGVSPTNLTVADGSLWFLASNGTNYDLIKSDGTTAGTAAFESTANAKELVSFKDRLYYLSGGYLNYISGEVKTPVRTLNDAGDLTPAGSVMYLTAYNGASAVTLHVTDGEVGGTLTEVKDENSEICNSIYDMTMIGNTLFLKASATGYDVGYELFKAEGSKLSLVKDINPGASSSELNNFTIMGNKLYFTATTDTEGKELWVSDGTETGTHIVKDINTGTRMFGETEIPNGSNISSITAIGDKLYFGANPNTDKEIWVSDGTENGTKLLIDVNKKPTSGLDIGPNIYRVGDKFIFLNDNKVWVSDGTAEGTANTGETARNISRNIDMGDYKIVILDEIQANKIMKTDGTLEGTSIIENFDYIVPAWLAVTGGKLFFYGRKNEVDTQKLYVSDGTTDSAVPFLDANNDEITHVRVIMGTDEMMLIRTVTINNPEYIYKLYASDGTSAGTKVLFEKTTEEQDDDYYNRFTFAGSVGYYVNETEENGLELWSTDGTKAGTVLVKHISDDPDEFELDSIVNVGETIYYILSDDEDIYTLWKTEGTPESTEQVKVFETTEKYAGPSKQIMPLAVIGDKFYFITIEESYDAEIRSSSVAAHSKKSDVEVKYTGWVIHNKTGIIQKLNFGGLNLSDYSLAIPYGATYEVIRGSEYMLAWLINKVDNSGKLIKVLGSSATVIQEASFIDTRQPE